MTTTRRYLTTITALGALAAACSSNDTTEMDWRATLVQISATYDDLDETMIAATPEEAEEVAQGVCDDLAGEDLAEIGDPDLLRDTMVSLLSDSMTAQDLDRYFTALGAGAGELCPAALADLEGFLGVTFDRLADETPTN